MRTPVAAIGLALALMVANTSVSAVEYDVDRFRGQVAKVDTATLLDLAERYGEFGDVPAIDPIIATLADYVAHVLRAAIKLRAHSDSLAGLFGGESTAMAASGTASLAAIALGRAADAADRLMHLTANPSAVEATVRLFPDLTTADLEPSLLEQAAHGSEKLSSLHSLLSHFAIQLAEGAENDALPSASSVLELRGAVMRVADEITALALMLGATFINVVAPGPPGG